LKHRYDSPWHTTIGGRDFYVDTWTCATNEKPTVGSDLEHIRALIRAQGYKMPAGMMYVRLVHLRGEQKRKELMFIYPEDLSATGFTAAEIRASQSAIRSPHFSSNSGRLSKKAWWTEPKRKSALRNQPNGDCIRKLRVRR
jgi:hypothetical protein